MAANYAYIGLCNVKVMIRITDYLAEVIDTESAIVPRLGRSRPHTGTCLGVRRAETETLRNRRAFDEKQVRDMLKLNKHNLR